MAFIEIQNLFKRFKDVVAINRIQLEISKGEMLTLFAACVSFVIVTLVFY